MNIDKDLIEYCKINNLDTHYMTKENFDLISKSIGYNSYKLNLSIKEIWLCAKNRFIETLKHIIKIF